MAARKTSEAKAKAQTKAGAARDPKEQAAAPAAEQGEAPAAEKAENPEAAPSEAVGAQAETPGFVMARVVEKFRDRESGSILKAGLTIAVAPERFEELEAAGVAKRHDA